MTSTRRTYGADLNLVKKNASDPYAVQARVVRTSLFADDIAVNSITLDSGPAGPGSSHT